MKTKLKFVSAIMMLLCAFTMFSCSNVIEDLKAKPISNTVVITDNPEESKLTANYLGSETVTYQWYKNGTAIPGATSSTFTYDVATMGGDVLSVKVTGKETIGSNSLQKSSLKHIILLYTKSILEKDMQLWKILKSI